MQRGMRGLFFCRGGRRDRGGDGRYAEDRNQSQVVAASNHEQRVKHKEEAMNRLLHIIEPFSFYLFACLLVFIIFPFSSFSHCCCCSTVFLSTEQQRIQAPGSHVRLHIRTTPLPPSSPPYFPPFRLLNRLKDGVARRELATHRLVVHRPEPSREDHILAAHHGPHMARDGRQGGVDPCVGARVPSVWPCRARASMPESRSSSSCSNSVVGRGRPLEGVCVGVW